jgi:hypothetical protein
MQLVGMDSYSAVHTSWRVHLFVLCCYSVRTGLIQTSRFFTLLLVVVLTPLFIHLLAYFEMYWACSLDIGMVIQVHRFCM